MVAFENKGAMAATVVVAASDSLNKAAANYVCDGVADETEINAALLALPVGRSTIEMVKCIGSFNISSPISIPSYSRLDLTEAKITLANGSNCNMIMNSNIVAGNTDIEIIGGIFNGNMANQGAGGWRGIRFAGGGVGSECSRILLQDIKLTAIYESAIYLLYVNNYQCSNVLIYSSGTDVNGHGMMITYTNKGVISGLIIYNVKHSGIAGVGNSNIDISNFLIDTATYEGIYLAGAWIYNAISNGVIQNMGDNGIQLSSDSNTHNTFSNIVIYHPNRGILLDTNQHYNQFNNIKIVSPTGGGSSNGIQGILSNDCTFNNINVYGANVAGIKLLGCLRFSITGGSFSSCGAAGISIEISGGTESQYGSIDGVAAHSNGTYGIALVNASNYISVLGNNVFNNVTAGIRFSTGLNNVIRGNAGYRTENSGTATVLNTTTSIVVNHGLITTPTRVLVTPRENPTNAVSFWWVDTLTATQFTIHVNADPGASNLDLDWHAQVGEG